MNQNSIVVLCKHQNKLLAVTGSKDGYASLLHQGCL